MNFIAKHILPIIVASSLMIAPAIAETSMGNGNSWLGAGFSAIGTNGVFVYQTNGFHWGNAWTTPKVNTTNFYVGNESTTAGYNCCNTPGNAH